MKRTQFRDFLLSLTKPLIITIETETAPAMVKKDRVTGEPNPYLNRIVHRTLRNGMLNCSYENAVNNQRGKETAVGQFMEPFNALALWNGKGEHIDGSKVLVRHRESGKEYLVLMPKTTLLKTETNESEYRPIIFDDRYFYLGTEQDQKLELIDKSLLLPYLKDVRAGSDRQEVEKPIFWRTIELNNIVGVKYQGEIIAIES